MWGQWKWEWIGYSPFLDKREKYGNEKSGGGKIQYHEATSNMMWLHLAGIKQPYNHIKFNTSLKIKEEKTQII